MRKLTIPLFIICSTTTFAQSQNKGIITYEDNSPIVYADIIILKDNLQVGETSTDENGIFISDLAAGTYEIRIEENGILLHSQEIVIGENAEIGVIKIKKSEEISLKETVVTGQKKLIEKKVDRLIFNTDLAEGAKGGNAIDALKLAPRIKVDESTDAISIVGKGSVSVMINDRLMQMDATQLANYLKTIRAEDIEKIEVITNPPAKYDASGNSGIVNIVLKNGKNESINGNISTSYSRALNNSFNNSASLNVKKGDWTLVSRIYNGDGKWENYNNSEIIYPTNYWKKRSNFISTSDYLGGGIGIDYQINKNLITGFNIDLSNGGGSNLSTDRTNIYDLPSYNLTRYITNDSNGSGWDWSYIGINYHIIKKFDKEGQKLTFDFDYSKNNHNENNLYNSNEFDSSDQPIDGKDKGNLTKTDSNSDRFNVSLDMEHPVKEWKMNYGTRLRFAKDYSDNNRFVRNDIDFIEDISYQNKFTYNENIYALYYSIERKMHEKWTAKVGLRYEHANVDGKNELDNSKFNRKYDGLFPTAYLMYEMDDNHSLSLNYSRRVNRPMIWGLNPMVTKINDYLYSQGNPDLVPSYSNNVELEFSYKDLSITSLYYSYSDDLTTYINSHDPLTQITVSRPINNGNTYSIGVSENLNVKPYPWWRLSLNANLYYIKTTGTTPERNYSLDNLVGEFLLTNNLELNKKKTLFANYTVKYDTAGSDQDLDTYNDVIMHNIGLRAMVFDKKLQLSFNINNLFENRNITYTSKTNGIISSGSNEPFRTYRFGVTYNFGKQFAIEKSKSNQEQGGGGGGK